MSSANNPIAIPGDNPIRDPEADVLGRLKTARSFAQQVLLLDASEGVAVGVFGPWGSGKTSFINLARKEFKQEEIPVLDFNPWMFSGAEQLVERFFAELSAEMGKADNLKRIGQAFRKYGDVLSTVTSVMSKLIGLPLLGEIIPNISKLAAVINQPESANSLRKKAADALKERDKPIVVVLDDVDRLPASEIRDIFKLVRLTGSFPNLIYIVACDRLRVERALEEQELPGRDYLEKIIQLPFDLPAVPRHKLQEQIIGAIERALADIENLGPIDQQVWHDVYVNILRPLIRNMRDVRRYAAAIQGTAASLDGRVARADMLGLEAVRLFLPDVFRRLPDAIDGLTVASASGRNERDLDSMNLGAIDSSTDRDMRLDAQIQGLIKVGRPREEVVRAMIRYLFPSGLQYCGTDTDYGEEGAGQQLQERRVAHENVLRFYIERVDSEDLSAFYGAKQAFAHMADRDDLDAFMRSLDPARWQDIVSHLKDFEDQFRPEHVEPSIVVLFNLLPDMPDQALDILRGSRSVTLPLLRKLENTEAVEAAVRRILPNVTELSSRLELVLQIGHRKKSGHRLISEEAAAKFETTLRKKIRVASVDEIAGECHLARLCWFARDVTDPSEDKLDIKNSPKLTFALLRSVRSEMTIAPADSRAVDQTSVLNWGLLTSLYDDEETLKERIGSLKEQFENLKPWIESMSIPLDEAKSLLELADKYLNEGQPGGIQEWMRGGDPFTFIKER